MDTTTLPIHPYTGLQAIGIVGGRPVWPVAGGSQPEGEPEGDADDLDDENAEDTDGEEGEEAEEQIDWKAKFEEQQAALEASQAKLQRARAQAKSLREKAEASTPPTPKPPVKTARPPAKAAPTSEPEAITVQDDSEVQRWQERAIKADARAQLLARGCDPDLIDAPLSRLRVGEIDWDEDEPILDEYLDAMEERYPKLFAKPEPPAPVRTNGARRASSIDQGAVAGAGAGRPVQARKSFGDMLWESGGGTPARRR